MSLGCPARCPYVSRRGSQVGMRGLGQDSASDYATGLNLLRSINAKIIEMEAHMAQRGPDPNFADLYQQVLDARNQYNALRDNYVFLYRAAFGSVPSGLQGLGADPITVGLSISAFVLALIILGTFVDPLYSAFMEREKTLQAQAGSDAQIAQSIQAAGGSADDIAEALRQAHEAADREKGKTDWGTIAIVAAIGIGALLFVRS